MHNVKILTFIYKYKFFLNKIKWDISELISPKYFGLCSKLDLHLPLLNQSNKYLFSLKAK